jgi:HAMP domain-containing protein
LLHARARPRDPEFHVNSLSGYAPIFGRDGKLLGALGFGIVDTDVRLILANAIQNSLVIIAAALVLTTMACSIFLGTLFTRGNVSLARVVRRFDGKNPGVRAQVRSRDEVGRLGASFNGTGLTSPTADQLRVCLDHRLGWQRRACS